MIKFLGSQKVILIPVILFLDYTLILGCLGSSRHRGVEVQFDHL